MKQHRLAFLLALLVALSLAAVAQNYPGTWEEISSQKINPTSSTALTVPTGTQWAQISIVDYPVHVSADATAATDADLVFPVGVYLTPPDKAAVVALRFLDTSAGASTVYVRYFRKR